MSYSLLRELADSWGLVFMGFTYLVLIGWHWRPRGKETCHSAASMIFDNEEGEADHG